MSDIFVETEGEILLTKEELGGSTFSIPLAFVSGVTLGGVG